MDHSDYDFETQLRQLVPVGCDDRALETFYQAGWNACAAQKRTAPDASLPQRSSARSFSVGLACGLLVALGISAWQFAGERPGGSGADRVAVGTLAAAAESLASPVDRKAGVARVPGSSEVSFAWNDFFDGLTPWRNAAAISPKEHIDEATQPLSTAARRYWSRVVVAEPNVPLTGGRAAAESVQVNEDNLLRSYPATSERLEELL